MKFIKPDQDSLNGMLTMIAGGDALAKECEIDDSAANKFQGLFVDDDGSPVATCACDLKTAAALGCALSMIPPGGAEAMVEDGELSETASNNFYEVMNILSSLLMNDKTPHLALKQVEEVGATPLEAETAASVGFELDLGKYGPGNLVFQTV